MNQWLKIWVITSCETLTNIGDKLRAYWFSTVVHICLRFCQKDRHFPNGTCAKKTPWNESSRIAINCSDKLSNSRQIHKCVTRRIRKPNLCKTHLFQSRPWIVWYSAICLPSEKSCQSFQTLPEFVTQQKQTMRMSRIRNRVNLGISSVYDRINIDTSDRTNTHLLETSNKFKMGHLWQLLSPN